MKTQRDWERLVAEERTIRMEISAKRKADCDHLAAHSLKLREESQSLTNHIRVLSEDGRRLREFSKALRQSLKEFKKKVRSPRGLGLTVGNK